MMEIDEKYIGFKFIVDGKSYDMDVQEVHATVDYSKLKDKFPILETPDELSAEIRQILDAAYIEYIRFMLYGNKNNWRKQHGLPMIRRKALSHVHR